MKYEITPSSGFEQVGQFQRVFGHSINKVPTIQPKQELALRINLILEEVAEYTEAVAGMTQEMAAESDTDLALAARCIRGVMRIVRQAPESDFEHQDLVAMADALTDINYVVYGAGHVSGLPLDDFMNEVHSSNMTKLGEFDLPLYNEDGKTIKGPNYRAPDLEKVLSKVAAGKGKMITSL